MRDLYRYLLAAALFLSCWILPVPLGWEMFFVGLVLAWSSLGITKNRIVLPNLYWERLGEICIRLFLVFLAILHIIPGFIVASIFADYLWIFAVAAVAHLALETYVILNRAPSPNKPKPVRIARGRKPPKNYQPNVWNR